MRCFPIRSQRKGRWIVCWDGRTTWSSRVAPIVNSNDRTARRKQLRLPRNRPSLCKACHANVQRMRTDPSARVGRPDGVIYPSAIHPLQEAALYEVPAIRLATDPTGMASTGTTASAPAVSRSASSFPAASRCCHLFLRHYRPNDRSSGHACYGRRPVAACQQARTHSSSLSDRTRSGTPLLITRV